MKAGFLPEQLLGLWLWVPLPRNLLSSLYAVLPRGLTGKKNNRIREKSSRGVGKRRKRIAPNCNQSLSFHNIFLKKSSPHFCELFSNSNFEKPTSPCFQKRPHLHIKISYFAPIRLLLKIKLLIGFAKNGFLLIESGKSCPFQFLHTRSSNIFFVFLVHEGRSMPYFWAVLFKAGIAKEAGGRPLFRCHFGQSIFLFYNRLSPT